MKKPTLFTIGYSIHEKDSFMAVLLKNNIDMLIDIRSRPQYTNNTEFLQAKLIINLKAENIQYKYLGNSLGGRPKNMNYYNKKRLDYNFFTKSPEFQIGISKIYNYLRKNNCVLMCSENDPLKCHRFLIISRYIINKNKNNSLNIKHLYVDNISEMQTDAENRLLKKFNYTPTELGDYDSLIQQAYIQQSKKYLFKYKNNPNDIQQITFSGDNMNKLDNKIITSFTICTIGFTKKNAEDFFNLLRQANVRTVIDIRLNNVSQLAGFTKKNDLEYFLKEILNIDYIHMPTLSPTKEILNDYKKGLIDWNNYKKQFTQLLKSRNIVSKINRSVFNNSCLLCSEAEPEHCHRKLITDYLQNNITGVKTIHL